MIGLEGETHLRAVHSWRCIAKGAHTEDAGTHEVISTPRIDLVGRISDECVQAKPRISYILHSCHKIQAVVSFAY